MFVEIVQCGTYTVKKVFLAIFFGIKVIIVPVGISPKTN